MSRFTTVARPYATAAFEYARDHNALETWSEQLVLLASVVGHEQMRRLLDDPRITRVQRGELILKVCGDRLGKDVVNLVKLLAENNRLSALPDVAEQFEQHRAEHEGTVEATVVSAKPLTEAQQKAIVKSLKARLHKNVSLNTTVDETLIGGAIIKAGDWVMDGSMKTRLTKLNAALLR